MKINFNGAYKEIAPLVGSPVSVRADAAAPAPFEEVLGSISPNNKQIAEVLIENASGARPIAAPEVDAMARLNLQAPELTLPHPERVGAPELAPPPVNEGGASVKTPAVVDVRRIKSAERFNAMPREERVSAVVDMVSKAGRKHGVDPALSIAVIAAESSFNAAAISGDGHESKGLMQLLDGTGLTVLKRAGLEAKYDPFNPEQNVDLGVGYLRHLHESFSSATTLAPDVTTASAANSSSLEKLAVAAFNAGEGRVAAAQGSAAKAGLNPALYADVESYLPKSTQEYVARVMRFKGTFESEFIG